MVIIKLFVKKNVDLKGVNPFRNRLGIVKTYYNDISKKETNRKEKTIHDNIDILGEIGDRTKKHTTRLFDADYIHHIAEEKNLRDLKENIPGIDKWQGGYILFQSLIKELVDEIVSMLFFVVDLDSFDAIKIMEIKELFLTDLDRDRKCPWIHILSMDLWMEDCN